MNFDWKGIVRSVAPMLGTALAGPLGGIAGAALGKALGTADNEPETLEAAISGATPEQLQAIQKADQDFKLQMTAMGFKNVADLEAIAAGDRANARAREIAVRDKTPMLLAFGVTVGFFGILAYMLKWDIPQGSRDVLNIMLGALATAWISVISYFFGSSAGSARKDEMLGGQK